MKPPPPESGAPDPPLEPEETSYIEYANPLIRHEIIDNYSSFQSPPPLNSIFFTLQGREIRVWGINDAEQIDELKNCVGEIATPVLEENGSLGERRWKITKKQSLSLQRCIQFAGYDLKTHFPQYSKEQEYMLTEEEFFRLFPIIKMPLHPIPRLEVVKQGLRRYFRIEQELEKTMAVPSTEDYESDDGLLEPIAVPFPAEEDVAVEKEQIELKKVEDAVLNSLDTTFSMMNLKVEFRKRGKDIGLGRTEPSAEDIAKKLVEIEDD